MARRLRLAGPHPGELRRARRTAGQTSSRSAPDPRKDRHRPSRCVQPARAGGVTTGGLRQSAVSAWFSAFTRDAALPQWCGSVARVRTDAGPGLFKDSQGDQAVDRLARRPAGDADASAGSGTVVPSASSIARTEAWTLVTGCSRQLPCRPGAPRRSNVSPRRAAGAGRLGVGSWPLGGSVIQGRGLPRSEPVVGLVDTALPPDGEQVVRGLAKRDVLHGTAATAARDECPRGGPGQDADFVLDARDPA